MRRFKELCLLILMLFAVAPNVLAAECIAHRGYSAAYQENTIEAITNAWVAGADAVELDVRITKDGALVLFHDEKLGDLHVYSSMYKQLQDATKYHVPTLNEAFDVLPTNRWYLLDIKWRTDKYLYAVSDAIKSSDLGREQVVLQGADLMTLHRLRDLLPEYRYVYVTGLDYRFPFRRPPPPVSLAKKLQRMGYYGVSAKGRKFLDERYIDVFQKLGLKFYVWTINKPERNDYYRELGVDGIITDRPEHK